LNKEEQIISLLSARVFGEQIADKEGLVVVAGRTGVAKSKIVRGLIRGYMNAGAATRRTPHLLTYEDPIEKYIDVDPTITNYTPRQRGQDVKDIEQVINDALRQTARIMFVGETRDPEQWNQLLRFAGTGHLVITTTHAGSLTEALSNILQAAKAREPSRRSVVADRLLAVIHLRAGEVDDTQFVLPALWLRTPIGVKALMAEGLASLLPNTPNELTAGNTSGASSNRPQTDLPPSSIGRYWFARELIKQAKEAGDKVAETIEQEVLRRGLAWDLEGV
jgi:Tfp pilus assembly pilus retraction ATPase PilT